MSHSIAPGATRRRATPGFTVLAFTAIAVVAFLASERASFVTGTAIQVEGGQVAGLFGSHTRAAPLPVCAGAREVTSGSRAVARLTDVAQPARRRAVRPSAGVPLTCERW